MNIISDHILETVNVNNNKVLGYVNNAKLQKENLGYKIRFHEKEKLSDTHKIVIKHIFTQDELAFDRPSFKINKNTYYALKNDDNTLFITQIYNDFLKKIVENSNKKSAIDFATWEDKALLVEFKILIL